MAVGAAVPARRVRGTVPRTRPAKPRPATRRRRRTGVVGGVVWIVFIALLLAGVVALNVAVLRLNVRLDELSRQKRELRAENAEVASQLAAIEASGRIQALARQQYGLVPAEPDETSYITVAPSAR